MKNKNLSVNTKINNKIKTPKNKTITSFINRSIKQSLLILAIALSGYLVYADYVGTLTNRIFLDPESLPAISDGYQNGDIISYIAESTPNPGSGSLVGAGAWNTLYIPPGVAVIGTDIVQSDGDGTYSAISAPAVAPIKDGCGNRGCKFPTTGSLQNAYLNEGQQDAGIFYSTGSRTQLLTSPYYVKPTGTGDQEAWNLWDAQHVQAYGGQANLGLGNNGALSANGGQGNTAMVDTSSSGGGASAVWAGTGSPVAGPQTYYTNDYNPACTLATNEVFQRGDLLCQGPWKRIAYPGSSIGGSGAVMPALVNGVIPNQNTSVATSLGWNISESNPLPSTVNAVRYVIGKRVVGQLETVRITFKITNVATFTASLTSPTSPSFCYDATGGDHDKDGVTGRGAQDSIWRYYEGNNHFCFSGTTNATAIKSVDTVDGASSSGSAKANSIIGFKLVFANTGTMPLYDIVFTDTSITPAKLALIPAGNALCPYPNYNGNYTGSTPTLNTLTATTATWNQLPVLGPGQTVTLNVCGQVDSGAKSGDIVRNRLSASYAIVDGGTPQPVITSQVQLVLSTVISGRVILDNDSTGTLTTGDTGISGVTVKLYRDNGTTPGVLDAGDTFLENSVTNGTGGYSFVGSTNNLAYLVVETGLSGLKNTADRDTSLGNCAAGALANTCNVISIPNLNGSSINNHFYNVGASIGDFVWLDLNGDGIQNGGSETGIAGVTLDLYSDTGTTIGVLDSGDTLIKTQTTVSGGAYDFKGLNIGNYIVDVTDTGGVLSQYTNTTSNDPLAVSITTVGQDFNNADFGYQQKADVTITKDDSVTAYIPGNPVTYVVTVNNIGPSNANGTVIADTFPSQITSVSWTCAATGSAVCPNATGTSSPLSETIATFPNGGQLVYTITAQTNPAATTDLINSATATVPIGITDPTSVANVNTATDPTDTPNFQSDLYITKSDTPTTYTPGGVTTYTVTIGNLGPSNVIGATVSDPFPNGLSLSAPITCVATGTATCNSPIGAANDTSFTDTVDIAADPSGIDATDDSYVTYTVPVKYSTVMTDY